MGRLARPGDGQAPLGRASLTGIAGLDLAAVPNWPAKTWGLISCCMLFLQLSTGTAVVAAVLPIIFVAK